ncbi:hypothetical protein J416_06762 [Gracilibacillus halophilus YIM-C55.5]|uniref:Peptidase C39-like domain-containing protein n=1 Tax=Gracilibacillus halophilus YIM-C55.5 TaxID=1308866 RepID=N4WRX0_9BACI|nr:C39 family peptidase [Gracilibacillus halophilus]ENH97130.1 hypothetical protein J416_06762 [Gracilibacillus halophilus YIM-C55.5]
MVGPLFIVSMIFAFFLFFAYQRFQKKIFQIMAMLYFVLFSMTSLGLGGYLIYTSDINLIHAISLPSDENRKVTNHQPIHKTMSTKRQRSVQMQIPKARQFPELPRGCEVTSLSMLLRYHEITIDKLQLAEQIKKDTTPYQVKNGKVHFGNPHNGFVGSMYTYDQPGYGVYHEPIYQLTKQHAGNRAENLTKSSFTEILNRIHQKQPVLIITNITYEPLPQSSFQTWQTPDGPIEVTRKQHAVVITGYDENDIYFNDPYDGEHKKAPKRPFIAAWEQMGKQAVTITNR